VAVKLARRRLIILWAAGAAIIVIGLLILAARVPFSSETLRKRVIVTLSDRLDAEVELGAVTLRALPSLHAEGQNLVIHHKGRRDVPPLISVKTVTIDASVLGLWRKHVAHVDLRGLDIQIPPNDHSDDTRADDKNRAVSTAGRRDSRDPVREVVIDEVVADEATLTILPRKVGKNPKVWYMHELHVNSVSAATKMPFRTYLTNAVPPGQIDTTGSFGPWERDDPGRTPVDGRFTFDDADLSVFKGISGILGARGSYGGSLERIDVKGETTTPDFMVKISGHTVPLETKYHAIVDGTNGDTTLEQIDATFLKTALVAKGGVYDVKGVPGRVVTLDVDIEKGRLEDIMRLAVKANEPPMTGGLTLKTKFELPPGDVDVVEKLKLDGAFAISGGRFTNAEVQKKINELSHRASAKDLDTTRQKVASDFSGRFQLANGTLALQKLTFDVPGAIIELDGQYSLREESLSFVGNLYMDAKVSETVSGWKSLLLKAVDPLFRKSGRTVIPLKISGARSNPSFGLDTKRVFRPEAKD
jgi:hypothetical protein